MHFKKTNTIICLASLVLLAATPIADARPSWLGGKKGASGSKLAQNPTQYADAYSGGAHSLWGPNSPLLGQMNSKKKTAQYKKHFMKARKKRFFLF